MVANRCKDGAASFAERGTMIVRDQIRDLLGLEMIPDALIGLRDIESTCTVFEPGEPTGDGDCFGDGHHICRECVRLSFDSENWPEA